MNKVLPGLGAMILMGIATTGHAFAADGTETGHAGKAKKLDKIERRQEKQIARGERSGKLSESEATAIKQRQSQIQTEKTQAMAQNNGRLTKQEAKHLKKEQRQLNKQLKRDLKS